MNRRMVLNTIGNIALAEAAFFIPPMIVCLIYGEDAFSSFLISAGVALAVGLLLVVFSRPNSRTIYAKEGFAIVAYAWVLLSAIGALPFVISGTIPSYVDAFFETVSGFTTTGASIMPFVEGVSKGVLFWRSFTNWVGGMGVLVFVMAVIPNVADRSMNIMRAEMPGPVVGKLVPRARDTAKILYLIYLAMTFIQVVLLFAGGMPLYDSIVTSFSTAGTGGFGIRNDSLASFTPYQQWVVTAFMLLFSINFNLYYLILIKRFKTAIKSTELWFFIGLYTVSISIVFINIYNLCGTFSEAIRTSSFQVASIVSTTGYSTVDFNQWPGLSKAILMVLMICGGCAGSTAGGLKISRVVILLKSIFREFKKMLHPRSVRAVSMEAKRLDEKSLNSVNSYFAIYMVCVIVVFIFLSAEDFNFETNFSATLSCFNNVGPGFGAVGPASNYSAYSDCSTVLLSLAMLLGRLEIYPLILGLNPFIWKKR